MIHQVMSWWGFLSFVLISSEPALKQFLHDLPSLPVVTYEVNQCKQTQCERILLKYNSLSYTFIDSVCVCSAFGSWPVAALAGVPVDEARLAAVQIGVSLEALEVSGLISYVFIQAIGAPAAEVCNGVPGGGGGWCCGGLWGEACTIRHRQRNVIERGNTN